MNDNALICAVILAFVASCTAESITDKVIVAKGLQGMTPQQICVQKAWTQTDRMECLKGAQ